MKKIFAVCASFCHVTSYLLIFVGTFAGLALVVGAPDQFKTIPADFIAGGLTGGLGFYILGQIFLEKAGLV